MRTLYIDCAMGAAGDMLTAALLELTDDPSAVVRKLNTLDIPGVEFIAEPSVKCGVGGTHMTVQVGGHTEGEHHHHHHDHDHEHGHHHHSSMQDIAHIINDLNASDTVKSDVMAVYTRIAEAESHVHGVPVTDIHFHEVGTMDAVADITAVCVLLEMLAPDRIVVSPIHVGSGQVRCAHGILPVPAPATAHILRGVPMYGGVILDELCTPTGAALLTHFADAFGAMPPMQTEKIGYGMGKKDFPAANCVRIFLGETADTAQTVAELCCNLDDMTAEEIGFAMDRLFDGGALDVFTASAYMKKNRPGTVLHVLCRPEQRETMLRLIFRHTTTIGVRECVQNRYTLRRTVRTVETACGEVRQKVSQGYGVTRVKTEYDDLAGLAAEQGKSLEEIRRMLRQENGTSVEKK